MANPNKNPNATLNAKEFGTFGDLLQYFGSVDIWIRRDGKHTLTPEGRRWEYPQHDQVIDPKMDDITIDIMDMRFKGGYIVALLFEDGQETPIPLEIGTKPFCCTSRCKDLRAHLGKLWPERRIVRACRISAPGSDVSSLPLTDQHFHDRTNDLYLHCEQSPDKSMEKALNPVVKEHHPGPTNTGM